jgi:hypothetical protein
MNDLSTATLDRVADCTACAAQNELIFRYDAPLSGPYDIDLCGSTFDTTMAIFDTDPCAGPVAPIVCNDDFCAVQSGATGVALVAGSSYWIVVESYCGGGGTSFQVNINYTGVMPCADIVLPSVPSVSQPDDLSVSTLDRVPDCGLCPPSSFERIFEYTAPITGAYDINLCSSPGVFDPTMAIYDTNPCLGGAMAIVCNDDFCILQSGAVGVPLVAGTTYWIVIEELCGGSGGPFVLDINYAPPPCPDGFLPSVVPVIQPGDLALATASRVDPTCSSVAGVNDHIYQYTAPVSGNYDLDLCSVTAFDSVLAVYDTDPCAGAGNQIACNDVGCGAFLSEILGLPLVGGVTYWIAVDSYNGLIPGPYELHIDLTPPSCMTCGDCNEDGTISNIIDALIAARISVGLTIPNPNQLVCCDVDSSFVIDVMDVLVMAQNDVGLMVPLVCP